VLFPLVIVHFRIALENLLKGEDIDLPGVGIFANVYAEHSPDVQINAGSITMIVKLVSAEWPFLKENKVPLGNFLETFRRTKGRLAGKNKKQFFGSSVKVVRKRKSSRVQGMDVELEVFGIGHLCQSGACIPCKLGKEGFSFFELQIFCTENYWHYSLQLMFEFTGMRGLLCRYGGMIV
jgi:hypothetical protein